MNRCILSQKWDRVLLQRVWGAWRSYHGDALGGLGLFAGVLAFNLTVTFVIGEVALGVVGCLWTAAMLFPILPRVRAARRAKEAVRKDET